MRKETLSLFKHFEGELKSASAFSKIITAAYLFDFLDRLRASGFPSSWFTLLEQETDKLQGVISFFKECYDIPLSGMNAWQEQDELASLESRTGNVYFQLWKDFSKDEYFQQTTELLQQRLKRNHLDVTTFHNALDAGCGGGRYTLALRKIGIRKITGIDVSPDSIRFAREMNLYPDEEVRFLNGSVLDLPFSDRIFDFVFSNGVLHHTASTEKGLAEIFRVLKTGGCCWLYLYGGKDSLFWDIVDICREILVDVPQAYCQHIMHLMGYPAGRIFHRLDFWYVPINRRYFASEIENLLKETGFDSFKRLKRGTGHDWDEIIYQVPDMDPYIYGEGEMRFWLCK